MLICADEKVVQPLRTSNIGLQYCLILPVTVSLYYDSSFLMSLVPITFILYINLCNRSSIGFLIGCVLSLCVVYHLQRLACPKLGVAIVMCLIYMIIIQYGPAVFQKSFSFGELSIIGQLYVYIMYCILTAVVMKMDLTFHQESTLASETSVTEKGVGVIFLMMNMLILTIGVLKTYDVSTSMIVAVTVFLVAVTFVCFLRLFLPLQEIKTLIEQLLLPQKSIILLLWWICCSVCSICIVGYYGNNTVKPNIKGIVDKQQNDTGQINNQKDVCELHSTQKSKISTENVKAHEDYIQLKSVKDISNGLDQSASNSSDLDTCTSYKYRRREVPMVVRKYFHVLILCVYVPGLMFNHQLLYVASSAVAAMFLLIETTRYLNIKPFSSFLSQYLQIFLDKQDQGDLILTPIYLLIGCSLPLWLFRPKRDVSSQLFHYSGLISVGVGDAAASVCGRKFGQHTWPDSKKTVEGTISAFLSQLIFLIFLNFAGVEDAHISIANVTMLLLISCLEAFTQHIDNLVVPLFAMMLFASLKHV